MIYPEISSQTLGIVSQVIMLNCTQFFSNGDKQPVVLQKVLASIRDHLIRNAGNPDMVDQAGFAYIVLFKYAQFGKDPQLVKVFTQTMLVYLQQLKKIWTFVQPSKLFTFCSPSIIQTEEMKAVLELFVDTATKMVSNCLKAMKDKVFENSAPGILHEYGGIRPELKELYYTGQVLRVLISAGQLGVLEQIPISQIVEFLELVGQTLPQDATASNFVNSMYLSVLYSLKSNP